VGIGPLVIIVTAQNCRGAESGLALALPQEACGTVRATIFSRSDCDRGVNSLDSLKAMTASRPPLTSELQLTCIIIGKLRRGRKLCMPIGRQENGTGSCAPRECDRCNVVSISLVDPCSATRRVPAAPIAPEFSKITSLDERGRRECRAIDSPAAPRAKIKSTQISPPQVRRNNPAFPARWFYGFLRALPGDRALLSPSLRDAKHHRKLTSASGYQDHTTSPSAASSLVS
jgi:hypothetical protein